MPEILERDELMLRNLPDLLEHLSLDGTSMTLLDKLHEDCQLGSDSGDSSQASHPGEGTALTSGGFMDTPDPAVMRNLLEEQLDVDAAKLVANDKILELSNMICRPHYFHILMKLWRCKLQNMTTKEQLACARILKRLQRSLKSIQRLKYSSDHDFQGMKEIHENFVAYNFQGMKDWHKSLEVLCLDLRWAPKVMENSADAGEEADDLAVYVMGNLEDYSSFLTSMIKKLHHLGGEEET